MIDGKPHDQANFENEMRDIALFHAVQQRAGKCGVPDIGEMPPAEKGRRDLEKEKERDRALEKMRSASTP